LKNINISNQISIDIKLLKEVKILLKHYLVLLIYQIKCLIAKYLKFIESKH